MKAGKAHRVPLSDAALAVLHEAALLRRPGLPGGGLVFPGKNPRRPISDLGISAPMRAVHPGITVHGFRSAFRDWGSEATNFSSHALELSLAHAIGSRVEAAYARGEMLEKRRQIMQAWGTFLTTEPQQNVVPMRRAG